MTTYNGSIRWPIIQLLLFWRVKHIADAEIQPFLNHIWALHFSKMMHPAGTHLDVEAVQHSIDAEQVSDGVI